MCADPPPLSDTCLPGGVCEALAFALADPFAAPPFAFMPPPALALAPLPGRPAAPVVPGRLFVAPARLFAVPGRLFAAPARLFVAPAVPGRLPVALCPVVPPAPGRLLFAAWLGGAVCALGALWPLGAACAEFWWPGGAECCCGAACAGALACAGGALAGFLSWPWPNAKTGTTRH